MIIGKGKFGRFLLATPTKCGTTTVEGVARRYERNNPDGKGFRVFDGESPRRQHRMMPPLSGNWRGADPHILLRNPYGRYTSIYEYLRAPANYSQWGAREVQGAEWGGHTENPYDDMPPMEFPQFLAWYGERRRMVNDLTNPAVRRYERGLWSDPRSYRSPWVWTDSQSQSLLALKVNTKETRKNGVGVLRLESLWADLQELAGSYGVKDLDLSPLHSNRSTARHLPGESAAVVADKQGQNGPLEAWQQYYGADSGLCSDEVFAGFPVGQWSCVNADRWGGPCPACGIGLATEARELGYLALESGGTRKV